MPTRLIRLITMQKVLKTCSNQSAKNTIWVVITSPNRHIASPLAMKEEESKQKQDQLYVHKNDVLKKKGGDNAQPSTRVTKILPKNYLMKTACYAKLSIKRGSTPR